MANANISIDTVGLGIAWDLNETYRVEIDTGFVEAGNLRVPIAGQILTQFTTAEFPPQIGNSTPANTTTAEKNIQDISFGIDRANVTVLGGNVYLYKQGSPNVLAKTYTVSNVNTTGNVVSFSVVGNLEASETYFVTSDANIFLDADGFKNNAITNSSSFSFVSPVAPFVSTTYPANNSVMSTNVENVVLEFDRIITANAGNLYLYEANTNSLIKTISVTDDATIDGANVEVDVVGNIESDEKYYVTTDANIVKDLTLIPSEDALTANTYTFFAPGGPFIVGTTPGDGNLLTTQNITFSFDRNITPYQGNIYILDNADQIIKSYDVETETENTSNLLRINANTGLSANTAYHVISNVDIVQDTILLRSNLTGNLVTFTTISQPFITNTYPVNGNINVYENEIANIISDQTISADTGNVYLKKTSDNSTVKTYTTDLLTSNVDTITMDITGLLDPSTAYYFTSDSDAIKNIFGFNAPAITGTSEFAFTTSSKFSRDWPNTFSLGNTSILGQTTYTANTYTLEFKTVSTLGNITSAGSLGGTFNWEVNNYPTDVFVAGHRGGNYGGTIGGGGGGAGAAGADSVVGGGVGGAGIISNITGANVEYGRGGTSDSATSVPTNTGCGGNLSAGSDGIICLRYPTEYANANIVTATGGTITTITDYTVHTFTSNSTFSITTSEPIYIEYLIVGAGGASGAGGVYSGVARPGGGGGAGAVIQGALEITTGNYTATVGSGGTTTSGIGNNGADTTIFGINAKGGGGGGYGASDLFSGQGYQGSNGGSGGGAGASVFGPTPGGQAIGGNYINSIGKSTITGNLEQLNNHLTNLTITPISNYSNFNNFNIHYKLINGANETVYRALPYPSAVDATEYIELLITGGESNGSSTIVDASVNNFSLTNNNVTYSTAQTKFASSSLYFNGTNAWLNYSDSKLQPTDDFTWEAWLYPQTGNTYPTFVGYGAFGTLLVYQNSTAGLKVEMDKDGTSLDINEQTTTSFTYNSWQHIAITRQGQYIRLFKDGVLISSIPTMVGSITQSNAMVIGAYQTAGGNYYKGYMEQIRLTNGVARYTSNFTPPTSGF